MSRDTSARKCLVNGSRNECVSFASVRSRRHGYQRASVVADKDAYTNHTTNIISQPQYFVTRCLRS